MRARHALDADLRVLYRHLRDLKRDALGLGGVEIITPADSRQPPRIRSVVQLDGDIVTEADLRGSADARTRVIGQHCAELGDYVRRMQRSMIWTRNAFAGLFTAGPPVVASVVWTNALPLVALAGSALITLVRRTVGAHRLVAAVALVALGGLTVVAQARSWLDGAAPLVMVWGLGLGVTLLAAGLAWAAGRLIRAWLDGARRPMLYLGLAAGLVVVGAVVAIGTGLFIRWGLGV